ncbi:MAG: helix-turn-helix transcriptional regulator [Bacteroidia bacterium]|nr:helix-turn-helix transcriptional regulator [Bacteroidia bacterium]MCF8425474.1 helix-turn-helix transcriptional regulator [Bacteroidia bacterium]MCF8445890.1 helix-turn-helix transcriptional regulator [Bacteroidia bacterium]
MDELNLRVLSVMEAKQMTKSTFALALDISLPVLTHISSGRNKPGIDLIQKILMRFKDISPDWLLLGEGPMFRTKVEKINLKAEIDRIDQIIQNISSFSSNSNQVLAYHELLLKEILYLKELNPYLFAINTEASEMRKTLEELKSEILSKLKD